MPISKDSVKNLLAILERRYPKTYENIEALKKDTFPQINPNELLSYLIFLKEEGYIDCAPITTDQQGIVDLNFIKINSAGIRFLRGF